MAIRRHTMIIRTEFNAEEELPNDMIKDGTTGKMVQLGHDSGVCYLFLSPWWLKFVSYSQTISMKIVTLQNRSFPRHFPKIKARTKEVPSHVNRSDLMTSIWQSLGLCGCVAGNVDPFPVLPSSVCQIKHREANQLLMSPTASQWWPIWMGRRDWLRWRDLWILQIS